MSVSRFVLAAVFALCLIASVSARADDVDIQCDNDCLAKGGLPAVCRDKCRRKVEQQQKIQPTQILIQPGQPLPIYIQPQGQAVQPPPAQPQMLYQPQPKAESDFSAVDFGCFEVCRKTTGANNSIDSCKALCSRPGNTNSGAARSY